MVSLSDIQRAFPGTLKLGEPLAQYSVLGVGGPADYVLEAASEKECTTLARFFSDHDFPYLLLQPDMVVCDKGFRGAVIVNQTGNGSSVSLFKSTNEHSAKQLVEAAGVDGLLLGGAEIHGNTVINNGHATAAEIHALVFHARRVIEQQSGVVLEPALVFIGFDQEQLARVA